MKQRILGYRKSDNGWNWKCNLLSRFTGRAYNPLTVRWFAADQKLVVSLPRRVSYYYEKGQARSCLLEVAKWLVPRILAVGSITLMLMMCAVLEAL